MAKKKEELDPETLELIQWCIEVEGWLVKGGATQEEAQEHIEEGTQGVWQEAVDRASLAPS